MPLSLVVFDLDFTLWDCGGTWCDCLSPPFRRTRERVVDTGDRHVKLYDDVSQIMDHLDKQAIPMALASRTEQPQWASQLLQLLEIQHRFQYSEIYPSSKLRHFQALQQDSQVPYAEMLFFDDEMRNIREVSRQGVCCVHVDDGMTWETFHAGVERLRET